MVRNHNVMELNIQFNYLRILQRSCIFGELCCLIYRNSENAGKNILSMNVFSLFIATN